MSANPAPAPETRPLPRVSVIVAVRNDEFRLARCIRSIQAQTMPEWELIVVDDGSTDRTREVAERAAELDPRIVVLSQGHRGPASARNYAARVARGAWLAIQDADDTAAPNRLERELALGEVSPSVGVVSSWVERVAPDGTAMGVFEQGPLSIDAFRAGQLAANPVYIVNGAALIRSDLFREVGGYPEDYYICEDLALYNLRLAPRCDIVALPEPLVQVSVHEDSTTRTRPRMVVEGDEVVRLNLRRVAAGLPLLSYSDSVAELHRASRWQRAMLARREYRYEWFNRAGAALSAGSIGGIVWLGAALLVSPAWTARHVAPRFSPVLRRLSGRGRRAVTATGE